MDNADQVLIAADGSDDAKMVAELLASDVSVSVSVRPVRAVDDFAANQPRVVVLAFRTLEGILEYQDALNSGLRGADLDTLPKFVALCHKNDLARVYQMVRQGRFEDYVLFWPTSYEGCRLPLAVLHAIRVQRLEAGGSAETERQNQVTETGCPVDARLSESTVQLDELGEAKPENDTVRLHSPAVTARRRIALIVDDERIQQSLHRHALSSTNLELAFASSAAEALKAVEVRPPDIILLDIGLPDMDGLDVLVRLRSIAGAPQVPVVMVTGNSQASTVQACIRHGATDFIVKPFDQAELVSRVESALLRSGRPLSAG